MYGEGGKLSTKLWKNPMKRVLITCDNYMKKDENFIFIIQKLGYSGMEFIFPNYLEILLEKKSTDFIHSSKT